MNAAIQPRYSIEETVRTLRSQQEHLAYLRDIAASFAACQIGPIIVADEIVQPRTIDIPYDLRLEIGITAMEISRLEREIADIRAVALR